MREAAGEAGFPGRALTITELNRHIKARLESDDVLCGLWVRGEISNFKHHTSGHMYLTLKDEVSCIRAVMFRRQGGRLAFTPANGMKVIALGSVSVYERDGQYQLYVEDMLPDGLGSLYLAFEQLKARLEAEGLFDQAKKRPVPKLPRTVALITSPTGAAIRDMITVARRRFPNVHLVVCPVLVQGTEAPAQISAALALVNRWGGADVIIVGRGGGSLEELWAFNDEGVARAIRASRVPVISAVGHETDVTIADLASDLRAPTPSAAAELAIPDKGELCGRLATLLSRSCYAVRGRATAAGRRLEAALARPVLARPRDLLRQRAQILDDLGRRLCASQARRIDAAVGWRDLVAGRLDALSPLATLGRGYAICRRMPGGAVVRDASSVAVSESVEVVLRRGRIGCRIEQVFLGEDTQHGAK
jgi:exodeoxyribonuclease VII large subunit